MRVLVCTLAFAGLLFLPAAISAQDQPASTDTSGVAMIARTTQAIDYRRGDHTDVDLTGTELSPNVSGKSKIITKKGLTDLHGKSWLEGKAYERATDAGLCCGGAERLDAHLRAAVLREKARGPAVTFERRLHFPAPL